MLCGPLTLTLAGNYHFVAGCYTPRLASGCEGWSWTIYLLLMRQAGYRRPPLAKLVPRVLCHCRLCRLRALGVGGAIDLLPGRLPALGGFDWFAISAG